MKDNVYSRLIEINGEFRLYEYSKQALTKENGKEFTGNACALVLGNDSACLSYSTIVCEVIDGVFYRHWDSYSPSTARHIKLWALEHCPAFWTYCLKSKEKTFKAFWLNLPVNKGIEL